MLCALDILDRTIKVFKSILIASRLSSNWKRPCSCAVESKKVTLDIWAKHNGREQLELVGCCLLLLHFTNFPLLDRGVHAATQCCAMKLVFPLDKRDKFVEDVNSFLPDDIRVHLLTKVSKGFNAKNDCTKRRYDYLLPTYVLRDNAEVSKLLSDQYAAQGAIVGAGYEGGYLDPALSSALTADSLRRCRESLLDFRAPTSTLDRLKAALQCYVGTKYYHNFTSGKTSAEANSQRYVLSFECGEPTVVDGVEYVLLSVVGQSFLLNQIRKMVCMACEVARGVVPPETLPIALSKDVKVSLAPTVLSLFVI